ncbi:MAG: hypothetical protein P4L67_00250, partial [Candidatus Pacebacteria bacterium]|nr:hypothetical protein [Candidatus Paceibacterota bacterium]
IQQALLDQANSALEIEQGKLEENRKVLAALVPPNSQGLIGTPLYGNSAYALEFKRARLNVKFSEAKRVKCHAEISYRQAQLDDAPKKKLRSLKNNIKIARLEAKELWVRLKKTLTPEQREVSHRPA